MTTLAILLLLLSAQATQNPSQPRSQPPPAYPIAGVVVDAVTGAPVPRARFIHFCAERRTRNHG